MKKSSEYIAESVFNVNAHYTKLQSRTKILFFDCLKNNKSKEYFAKEVKKIWHDIDHRFMDNQIKKIQDIVWNNNVELALNKGRLVGKYQLDKKWVIDDEFFKIVPETQFREFERAFEKKVVQNYERSKKNINQVIDKEEYLQDKVESYDKQINQTISYFNNQGEAIRQVQLSTYLSMVHNTTKRMIRNNKCVCF